MFSIVSLHDMPRVSLRKLWEIVPVKCQNFFFSWHCTVLFRLITVKPTQDAIDQSITFWAVPDRTWRFSSHYQCRCSMTVQTIASLITYVAIAVWCITTAHFHLSLISLILYFIKMPYFLLMLAEALFPVSCAAPTIKPYGKPWCLKSF